MPHHSADLKTTLSLSEINPELWPAFIVDMQYEDWRKEVGEASAEELIAAMTSVRAGSLEKGGAISSGGRLFRFCHSHEQSDLARLDWSSSEGRTFSLAYDEDERLHVLAKSEPLQAAQELADRFLDALTVNDKSELPLELHAMVLRDAFLDESELLDYSSIMYPDSWSGRADIELPEIGLDRLKTDLIAPRVSVLQKTTLPGPAADCQILMSPGYHSGVIDIEEPWYGYSRQAFERLALEVNTVLANADLPLIPETAIARLAETAKYVPSSILYEQYLADPARPVQNYFAIAVLDNEPIMDDSVNTLAEDLETASSLENGIITTKSSQYEFAIIEDYVGYYSISPVNDHPSGARPDYFSPILALPSDTKSLQSENSGLEFLKGLNRQRANNASDVLP